MRSTIPRSASGGGATPLPRPPVGGHDCGRVSADTLRPPSVASKLGQRMRDASVGEALAGLPTWAGGEGDGMGPTKDVLDMPMPTPMGDGCGRGALVAGLVLFVLVMGGVVWMLLITKDVTSDLGSKRAPSSHTLPPSSNAAEVVARLTDLKDQVSNLDQELQVRGLRRLRHALLSCVFILL